MAGRGWRRAGRLVGGVSLGVMAVGLVLSAGVTPAGAGTSSSVAQAKKHLLVLADLPKGWTVEKGSADSGGGSLPGGSQLAACIGVPASVIDDNSPEADGPYYQNKDQSLEVQDSISVFPSTAYAKAQLSAMGNAKTPGCVAAYLNGAGKSLFEPKDSEDGTVGTITVTPLNTRAFGPGVVGIVMNVPITDQGVSLTTQIISVNAIKGRLGQSITYNSYGLPFPSSLSKHLDSVALGRL
jgi:hypothetical protein